MISVKIKQHDCSRVEETAKLPEPPSHDNIERPYTCEYEECRKKYTTRSHLLRHIKIIHSGENLEKKSFICTDCQQGFRSKQSLQKHILNKHKRNFPFQCEYCLQGFKKKTHLAAHIYLHTGLKLLKCKFCDKSFDNQSARYKHQRNHKMFTCECGKVFTRWADILQHKRTEHVSDRYECDICNRVFRMRAHIVRHLKIHPVNQEREIFLCPTCPKFYTFKSNLVHHINSVHENLTYDCTFPGCEAKLSTKKKLEHHREKKHINPPVKRKKSIKPRNKRRDFGVLKRSTAVKLSGESVPLKNEKEIIKESESDHT
ncbi:zinc finger and BTB domain-containing protein 41-like [Arctopsyche grandis]|uniref:zinc finger and BTB domain-containing protein 41-like n=1 Tax=Arctopsyche grandis TaxID=121162 RepID=UPI00406D9BAB